MSVVWQQGAVAAYASAVDRFRMGSIVTHVGAAGSALAWIACGLEILGTVGIAIMIASIRLLDRLTEGDDESTAFGDNDEG